MNFYWGVRSTTLFATPSISLRGIPPLVKSVMSLTGMDKIP